MFLEFAKNPFPLFFKRGLNVALSTDDPLIIHLTREPLVEEYAVAAQVRDFFIFYHPIYFLFYEKIKISIKVWNLSNVDLAEIARNSVVQSSFEEKLKKHWIGDYRNWDNSKMID